VEAAGGHDGGEALARAIEDGDVGQRIAVDQQQVGGRALANAAEPPFLSRIPGTLYVLGRKSDQRIESRPNTYSVPGILV
jgi:hypothetical protein